MAEEFGKLINYVGKVNKLAIQTKKEFWDGYKKNNDED